MALPAGLRVNLFLFRSLLFEFFFCWEFFYSLFCWSFFFWGDLFIFFGLFGWGITSYHFFENINWVGYACFLGDTKVLAAVYGPKVGTKKNENPEKACIEVIWKPKTGQIGEFFIYFVNQLCVWLILQLL